MSQIKLFICTLVMALFVLSTPAFSAMHEDQSNTDSDEMAPKEEAAKAWDDQAEAQTVNIDVKPDDDMNLINTQQDANLKVALLGSEDFDVSNVDEKSLKLGEIQNGGTTVIADSNADGIDDLIIEFPADALKDHKGTKELALTGQTKDGKSFEGSDQVTFE